MAGKYFSVEMVEIESTSESVSCGESTVRSFSLAELLHLANFFVVRHFYSVNVATYTSFIKIYDSPNFI